MTLLGSEKIVVLITEINNVGEFSCFVLPEFASCHWVYSLFLDVCVCVCVCVCVYIYCLYACIFVYCILYCIVYCISISCIIVYYRNMVGVNLVIWMAEHPP